MVEAPQPAPQHREQLDQIRCQTPGCTCDGETVILGGRCHPYVPVFPFYTRADGVIRFRCGICRAFVSAIQVAP